MVLPIALGLGLLAGNALYGRELTRRREDQLATDIRGLLGAPAQFGAGDEGPTMTPGTGLMGNWQDPTAQAQFAAGIMGLRGQSQLGANMLGNVMQRAQQGQQFGQELGQRQQQWAGSEARMASQFDTSHQLQREQFQAQQLHNQQAQANWVDQFAAQGARDQWQMEADRARLGMQAAGLGLERARLEQAQRPDMPKLPVGYAYIQTATGPAAAPIPGTPDYNKGVAADGALSDAQNRIQQFTDLIQGAQREVGGRKVRAGGTGGTALWGETAAQLSGLRSQIIADVAVLRDMGVLQAGELERIEKDLGDPTSWKSLGTFTRSTLAGYGTLSAQFKAKQDRHREGNPWLLPAPPPRTVPVPAGGMPRAAGPRAAPGAPAESGVLGMFPLTGGR